MILDGANAGWGYMGCYTDNVVRVLPVALPNVASISACQQAASNAGYSYFGLEVGAQCWWVCILDLKSLLMIMLQAVCLAPCRSVPLSG